MQSDKLNAVDAGGAAVSKSGGAHEGAHAEGFYLVECFDADGNIKWAERIDNLVANVGKNFLLDNGLAGSAFTAYSYMGLAGGTPASAAATDTMATKTSWTEVGGTNAPAYTGNRKGSLTWSAAATGSKAVSSAQSFAITSSGTVAGCFIVLGTAAGTLATKDDTTGSLYSVGAFTGGSKTVANGDTLNVTYSTSL